MPGLDWEDFLKQLAGQPPSRRLPEKGKPETRSAGDLNVLYWLRGHVGDCFEVGGKTWCILPNKDMPDGISVGEQYSYMSNGQEVGDYHQWPWKEWVAEQGGITPTQLAWLDKEVKAGKEAEALAIPTQDLIDKYQRGETLDPSDLQWLENMGVIPAGTAGQMAQAGATPTAMPLGQDAAAWADYYETYGAMAEPSALEQYYPFTAEWPDEMKRWGDAILAEPTLGREQQEAYLSQANTAMTAGVPAKGVWEGMAQQRKQAELLAMQQRTAEPSQWYERIKEFQNYDWRTPGVYEWPDMWRTSRGMPTTFEEEWARRGNVFDVSMMNPMAAQSWIKAQSPITPWRSALGAAFMGAGGGGASGAATGGGAPGWAAGMVGKFNVPGGLF